MRRYKKLLVGLSLDDSGTAVSPGSRRAVEEAQWLAAKTGGAVTLFHAIGDGESAVAPSGPSDGKAALERAPAPIAEFARQFTAGAPSSQACQFAVEYGPATEAITRRVMRGENDFVVVAKRNALGSASRRLGTIAARLVRNCPSPVWIVHTARPFPHKNVMAATDLEPVGALATQLGAWFAREMGAKLEVVHAWQMPMDLEMERANLSPAAYQERVQTITETCAAKVRDGLAAEAHGAEPVLHIGNDKPSTAILALVEKYAVDMLVLGSVGRSGLSGALVGNTAERLLHEVDCSLLTVKPDGFKSPIALA